jgi:hypothetical protein
MKSQKKNKGKNSVKIKDLQAGKKATAVKGGLPAVQSAGNNLGTAAKPWSSN